MPVLNEPVESTRWHVMIEESVGGGENVRWAMSRMIPVVDRESGRELARQLVLSHEPEHPFTQRERSVYAAPGDTWTVVINGAMSTFHFKISVVEWLGDFSKSKP